MGPVRLSSRQQELLRWLALLTMVIDHVGAIFLTGETAQVFRSIGRIAWPLFAFLLAYNVAVRRVDPERYLKPLALFTLIAQLPHWLAFSSNWVSIMGTLLLGALSLYVLERRNWNEAGGLMILAGVLLLSPFVEYGTEGVLLIAGCWWLLRTPTVFSLIAVIAMLAAVNYPSATWPYALLAVPVVVVVASLPRRIGLPRSGRLPWLFYPLHLLVLALIAYLLDI